MVDPSRVVSNRNAKTVHYNIVYTRKRQTKRLKRNAYKRDVYTRRPSVTRDVCGILLCTGTRALKSYHTGGNCVLRRIKRLYRFRIRFLEYDRRPTGTRTRRARVYRVRLRRRRGNTKGKKCRFTLRVPIHYYLGDGRTSERLERAHLGWKTDAAAPARSAGPTVIREKRPFPRHVQYVQYIYIH